LYDSLTVDPETETNEVLSTLGNSLLGLFASEHLTSQYPYLPTESLKQAVTAYVGPSTCLSVGKELGLATTGGYTPGISVRYHLTRTALEVEEPQARAETVPSARRFRKYEEGQEERRKELEELRIADKRRSRDREGFEDVVACSVRAFVGLIYQEMVSQHQGRQRGVLKRYRAYMLHGSLCMLTS
jgi:large subunit ribosomal protein L44